MDLQWPTASLFEHYYLINAQALQTRLYRRVIFFRCGRLQGVCDESFVRTQKYLVMHLFTQRRTAQSVEHRPLYLGELECDISCCQIFLHIGQHGECCRVELIDGGKNH